MNNKKRYADRAEDFPCKSEDGSKQCRWCGKPLRVGFYCSPHCKLEVDVRCGWDLDRYIFKRDKGICADCGLDCVATRAISELSVGRRYVLQIQSREQFSQRTLLGKAPRPIPLSEHLAPFNAGLQGCERSEHTLQGFVRHSDSRGEA